MSTDDRTPVFLTTADLRYVAEVVMALAEWLEAKGNRPHGAAQDTHIDDEEGKS